jgi:hypothetical protein
MLKHIPAKLVAETELQIFTNCEIFPFGMAKEMLETVRNPKFCFLK